MIKDQSQRSSQGVGKDFGASTVRLKTKDATVVGSAIDPILTVDGDVLGRETVDMQPLNLCELRILRVDTR